MREAVASAPGKVNLELLSGPAGPDGYHELFTVFEAIGNREYVHARTSRPPGVSVETVGYAPTDHGLGDPVVDRVLTERLSQIPAEEHLAVRAAKALMPLVSTKWGPSASGLHLTVHKALPAAGGLAGGSADAAATLVAVSEMWELGLSGPQLEAVGRTLGADVPACIHGNWSIGAGRGDHMETLALAPAIPAHWWALAFFREGLSTPVVFRQFDAMGLGRQELPTGLRFPEGDYIGKDVGRVLHNDLAPATLALRPELAGVGADALRLGATAWMISGSGPTVAALAASSQEAQEIAAYWSNQAGQEGSVLSGAVVTWGADSGARTERYLPTWAQAL